MWVEREDQTDKRPALASSTKLNRTSAALSGNIPGCHHRIPQLYMGGVNHCHLYCRLAKFRDLVRRVKYGAVIGHKLRFFVCAQYELPGYGFFFSQSQRRIQPSSSNHGISPHDSVNDSG
jgi:hypothetical protein